MMKMIERGKALLTQWEGVEDHVDVAGLPTIGVGHLLSRDELSSGKIYIQGKPVRYTNGLTQEQVSNLLSEDLKKFEEAVNAHVTVPLPQNQFDALVSFAFNVGIGAFKNSTLLKVLNQGNDEEVPAQLRRWVFSGLWCHRMKNLRNDRRCPPFLL